jgi:hypothetical protein
MGLLDFFSKKPAPVQAPQPGGLLGQVPTGQQQMSYRDYAEQEMMKGRQPMPLADWQKAQQAPKK